MPTPRKPRSPSARQARWSQQVTRASNALDLEPGVFTRDDPRAIAQSLKTSAEASRRRKAAPFRSAMSMLTFYVNRAGSQLPARQRARLEAAKDELRVLFGRPRRMKSKEGRR
jgi:Protein of unknown function (DUF3175)